MKKKLNLTVDPELIERAKRMWLFNHYNLIITASCELS